MGNQYDDQTIYQWRLADVRRVIGLAAQLPGLRRVDLVTNYRCPRPVVERAVRLIAPNRERFAKTIRARPSADGQLFLVPDAGDDVARARRLLREWAGQSPGVHAVLARTNAELTPPYAGVALEMGLPYQARKTACCSTTPASTYCSAPIRPTPPACLRSACPAAPAATRWRARCWQWATPYRTWDELRSAVDEARRRRAELRRDDAELVLATAHGTKGLEFDHVACIGLDEGVFPSRRTLEEADDPRRALEEERRLAYVAWRHARRSLVLLYDPAAPSPFLREAFSDAELGLSGARPERQAA